jgi:hypothetical protein
MESVRNSSKIIPSRAFEAWPIRAAKCKPILGRCSRLSEYEVYTLPTSDMLTRFTAMVQDIYIIAFGIWKDLDKDRHSVKGFLNV